MTAHLTATAANYATATSGTLDTGSGSTYTFGAANTRSHFEMWTGNDKCGYIHWGSTLVTGGWAGRYLKYGQTSVNVGFASKTGTIDVPSGTNTFRFQFNGGVNQMILSVTSGTTNWSHRVMYDNYQNPA